MHRDEDEGRGLFGTVRYMAAMGPRFGLSSFSRISAGKTKLGRRKLYLVSRNVRARRVGGELLER